MPTPKAILVIGAGHATDGADWNLHTQARDAWTHELDLRPGAATW